MAFIWSLIIGGIIGWLGQIIVGRNVPGGIIGNVVCGILGAWVGQGLFPEAGPVIGGMALLPSILGAVIVVFVFSLIVGRGRR